MKPISGFFRWVSLAVASILIAPSLAQAQLPAGPQATLIVPYPAGSAFDITARQIHADLAKNLGKTVIIENLGGASGSIGAQRMLNADSRNLTMLVGSANELALPPLTLSGVRYKPEDFRLVAHLTSGVLAVLARPDYPAKNLGELIASAKRPGAKPVSVANVGLGSIFHIAAADLNKRTGVAVTHVPYKGGAPIMQDLMGSQVDITVLPLIPSYIQAAQEGKIKVLAVLGAARHSAMPDTPAADEIPGLTGMHYTMWTGLFVSSKLSVQTADLIGKATNPIVASSGFRQWVQERGNAAGTVMDLEKAAAFYRAESDKFKRLAGEIGLERE